MEKQQDGRSGFAGRATAVEPVRDGIPSADPELIYEALRFFFWAAGEGICPIDKDAAAEPEECFWDYGLRTGDEDWETVAERYREANNVAEQ